jgi:PAS domain S-box-containing protein
MSPTVLEQQQQQKLLEEFQVLHRSFATVSEVPHLPYATALADVMSPSEFEQRESELKDFVEDYEIPHRSFATALSDVTSPSEFEQKESEMIAKEYELPCRPLATALSDVTSPSEFEQKESEIIAKEYELPYRPFATALSDTMCPSEFEQKDIKSNNDWEYSKTFSFASPESDFTACSSHEYWEEDEYQSSMAYSLAYASPESDFSSLPLSDEMRIQLRNSKNALKRQEEEVKLPTSYIKYLEEVNPEPLVVTEASAPFRIVDVNGPWEKLCGFSLEECQGDTLSIIQGPETDRATLTMMLSRVLDGSEDKVGAEVINYDRDRRAFRNRLTMGPLKDDKGNVTHFVGMLQELSLHSEDVHTTAMRM